MRVCELANWRSQPIQAIWDHTISDARLLRAMDGNVKQLHHITGYSGTQPTTPMRRRPGMTLMQSSPFTDTQPCLMLGVTDSTGRRRTPCRKLMHSTETCLNHFTVRRICFHPQHRFYSNLTGCIFKNWARCPCNMQFAQNSGRGKPPEPRSRTVLYCGISVLYSCCLTYSAIRTLLFDWWSTGRRHHVSGCPSPSEPQ